MYTRIFLLAFIYSFGGISFMGRAAFAENTFHCRCTTNSDCYVLPTDVKILTTEDGRLKVVDDNEVLIDAQRTTQFGNIVKDGVIYNEHAEFNVLSQNLKFRKGNTLVIKDLLATKSLNEEGKGFVRIHGIYVGSALPIKSEAFYDSLECSESR